MLFSQCRHNPETLTRRLFAGRAQSMYHDRDLRNWGPLQSRNDLFLDSLKKNWPDAEDNCLLDLY